jgi:tetratricopeptide (TPR) repeat protein
VILAKRVIEIAGVDPRSVREAASAIVELLSGTGREAERIFALEQIARVEDDALERRRLLRTSARARKALGEPARALQAWDARLAYDPADLEALAEAVELCAELGYHDALVVRLRERGKRARLPGQRRQDMMRVAWLEARELHSPTRAVDTLLALREEVGDDPEILSALDQLLSESGRHAELASVLEGESERAHDGTVARLCRLGDVYRSELGDSVAAARAYARALELAPAAQKARAGLLALSTDGQAARAACAALARAYAQTGDYELTMALLDARLASSEDPAEQATWMLEVAELYEQRKGDLPRALTLVGKALTRVPMRVHVERDLVRLAELTGRGARP